MNFKEGKVPKCLEGAPDTVLANYCGWLAINSSLQPVDMDELACLAQLADALVCRCGILYGKETFIGFGLGGCVDWELDKPRQKGLGL